MRAWSMGLILGAAGIAIGCPIVWWAAHGGPPMSDGWMVFPLALPVLGVLGGFYLSGKMSGGEASWPVHGLGQRTLIALVGGSLSALGYILAFVLVSRIWNADTMSAAESGLLYQLTHPWRMPSLHSSAAPGSPTSEMTWLFFPCCGFFVGAFMTFLYLRRVALAKPARSRGSSVSAVVAPPAAPASRGRRLSAGLHQAVLAGYRCEEDVQLLTLRHTTGSLIGMFVAVIVVGLVLAGLGVLCLVHFSGYLHDGPAWVGWLLLGLGIVLVALGLLFLTVAPFSIVKLAGKPLCFDRETGAITLHGVEHGRLDDLMRISVQTKVGIDGRDPVTEVHAHYRDAAQEPLSICYTFNAQSQAECLALGLGRYLGVPVLADGQTLLWQPPP
jgi:hypothetical protein